MGRALATRTKSSWQVRHEARHSKQCFLPSSGAGRGMVAAYVATDEFDLECRESCCLASNIFVGRFIKGVADLSAKSAAAIRRICGTKYATRRGCQIALRSPASRPPRREPALRCACRGHPEVLAEALRMRLRSCATASRQEHKWYYLKASLI